VFCRTVIGSTLAHMATDRDSPEESGAHAYRSSRRALRYAFLASAIATVNVAPWLVGGYWLSVQWWLLGGALLTLALGVLHRWTDQVTPGAKHAWKVQRWIILLGVMFLALMWVQAENPSHRVVLHPPGWEFIPLNPTEWAPKSLEAPFDGVANDYLPYRNTWRYLLIFSIGWAYAAGLASGMTRRTDAQTWVKSLAVNGAIMAVVCLVHRATNQGRTLWLFQDTFDFTSSPLFFYKNHNGAYLAVLAAAAFGCASIEQRSTRRMGWALTGALIWAATAVVNSRFATVCATAWLAWYAYTRVRAHWAERTLFQNRRLLLIGALAMAMGAAVFLSPVGRAAFARFHHAYAEPGDFLRGGKFRAMIRELGIEMWSERPAFGWGGGAYLYLFNSYHTRVPEIAEHLFREQPNLNRVIGPTANCDWIEFMVEYGLVGTSLLALAVVIPVMAWLSWRSADTCLGNWLIAAALGLTAHAYFDYILRSVPLFMLLLSLLMIALRLSAPGASAHEARRSRIKRRQRIESAATPKRPQEG
jgi:hypothetical protein